MLDTVQLIEISLKLVFREESIVKPRLGVKENR